MDRYFVRPDGEDGYVVEVTFSDGSNATARGFSSEEEAERWVQERWRERERKRRPR